MLCICDYIGLEMKFECSKLLRSSQADHDYIFLLCILSRNLSEPFWPRAQQQLQFRNSRFSTCQCTCAITHSWRWDGITNDGITNEVLVERLYRTSSGKFCLFVMHSSSLSMAWVADSDIFGWQGIYSLESYSSTDCTADSQFSTWVDFSTLRVGLGFQIW